MNELEATIEIVSEYTSIKPDKLSPDMRLFHDLGIDGDDAEELLMDLMDKHQVYIDDFNFYDYFGQEFGSGGRYIMYKIFIFFDWPLEIFGWSLVDNFKPLTVKDLAIAIENGFLK